MALKLAVTDSAVNRITADGKAESKVEGGCGDAQSANRSVSAPHMLRGECFGSTFTYHTKLRRSWLLSFNFWMRMC